MLSLYPGNLIGLIFFGDDTTFPGSDKLHHFLSYLVLTIFGYLGYYEKKFFRKLLIFLFFFWIFFRIISDMDT